MKTMFVLMMVLVLGFSLTAGTVALAGGACCGQAAEKAKCCECCTCDPCECDPCECCTCETCECDSCSHCG
ncbi:MAG: hypothetical protein GXY33_07720 [Phycisphaerae bacterium]|nr:hypothetical protein [Phycisphaerae bacterium]